MCLPNVSQQHTCLLIRLSCGLACHLMKQRPPQPTGAGAGTAQAGERAHGCGGGAGGARSGGGRSRCWQHADEQVGTASACMVVASLSSAAHALLSIFYRYAISVQAAKGCSGGVHHSSACSEVDSWPCAAIHLSTCGRLAHRFLVMECSVRNPTALRMDVSMRLRGPSRGPPRGMGRGSMGAGGVRRVSPRVQ